MKLSIVTSLYFSGPYINDFYLRISDAVRQLPDIGGAYEIVFVNDGSPDNSFEKATLLARADEHVRVIDLTRNFGHHKALLTGIEQSKGDLVFVIDCDLEEEPELLIDFYRDLMADSNVDVVFGVQASRRGGWIDRHVARLFYTIFNFLSDISVPADQLVARLMRRSYVESLVQYRETDFVMMGICQLAGHRQIAHPVIKGHKRSTTYNLSRKVSVLIDAITSFSARPLELIFSIGLIIFAISVITLIVLVSSKVIAGSLIGWTSLCASIWLFGGLMLMAQGVIGLYIARIFRQVKSRPFSLIRYDSAVGEPPPVSQSSDSHRVMKSMIHDHADALDKVR